MLSNFKEKSTTEFYSMSRFSTDVTVIQIDVCAEELDANKTLALQGDIAASMQLFLV